MRRNLIFKFTVLASFLGWFSLVISLEHSQAREFGYLEQTENRTLVPIRFISEQLGAEVSWNADSQAVQVQHNDTTIDLTIGSTHAYINGEQQTIDVSPQLQQGRTYVPLRFINDGLGFTTSWDASNYIATVENEADTIEITVDQGRTSEHQNGTVSGISANYSIIDLTNRHLDIDLGIAEDNVGQVEQLPSLASRHQSTLAVNGTFFDAYTENNDPYGVLIDKEELLHIGRDRTTIGFTDQHKVVMDVISPRVEGSTDGDDSWSGSWYTTWVNRSSSGGGDESIMYTPAYGDSVTHQSGQQIVIENGTVQEITNGTTSIPRNGYILFFDGSPAEQMLDRFSVGTEVDYSIDFQADTTEQAEWEDVITAVGAGPRLVRAGQIDIGTKAEGFNDPSITQQAAARSAIGVTSDRRLIVLATPSASMQQLAQAMQSLGAEEAMNLDGGASSGLYRNGASVVSPGRPISNALLFNE
ncbi:stalk domain-containing protein [Salsuginibacillus kocurii]|uniref:stalk domain-containing protein n=1 Tax=Salsuginibacillus kocurii TaxID=427078 RepID=UPI00038266ED|nr:stalk domain-containing protein [Salsuginibacillus kocurii]